MKLFCIDPGTTQSAYVLYEPSKQKIHAFGIEENNHLLTLLEGDRLVIEMVKSYGNAMGDSLLQTCVWIGRFTERWGSKPVDLLPRKSIVTTLCQNPRANDANVRKALIDRFEPSKTLTHTNVCFTPPNDQIGQKPRRSGGLAVGTKSKPGPLYGFKRDLWAALAIAVVWQEIYDDIMR